MGPDAIPDRTARRFPSGRFCFVPAKKAEMEQIMKIVLEKRTKHVHYAGNFHLMPRLTRLVEPELSAWTASGGCARRRTDMAGVVVDLQMKNEDKA
ncbi:MAG: hypothetical protein VXY93_01760, partial [Pseudomonadota bacterium]|nr:hypothetical protein [Pseudomonadota bacterium]